MQHQTSKLEAGKPQPAADQDGKPLADDEDELQETSMYRTDFGPWDPEHFITLQIENAPSRGIKVGRRMLAPHTRVLTHAHTHAR